jgi:uncharacterized protein YecE (DUF72 family)
MGSGKIRFGTCSWAEKSLLASGEFYPPGTGTAEKRLRHYARFFNTVEVDSTYYAIPLQSTAERWAERTPDDFVFHIKVYGALTGHGVNPRTLPKEVAAELPDADLEKTVLYLREPSFMGELFRRQAEALGPLKEAGKLGLMVFQFPPWFRYSGANLRHILGCRERMEPLPVGVEFRHGSWLGAEHREETFRFLEGNGLTYVVADEPQFSTRATVPFVPHVTSGTAYFRFHGRNTQNWFRKGIETSLRYDYLYCEEELRGFLPALRDARDRAKDTHVMFNNCHGSSAVRNALRMRELVEGGEEA